MAWLKRICCRDVRLVLAGVPPSSVKSILTSSELFFPGFIGGVALATALLIRFAWDGWAQGLVRGVLVLAWGWILLIKIISSRGPESNPTFSKPSPPVPGRMILFGCGVLLSGLSALFSQFPHSVGAGFLNDVTGGLFFLLALASPGADQRWWGWAIQAGAFFTAALLVLGGGWNARWAEWLINPNVVASYLVLAYPLLLGSFSGVVDPSPSPSPTRPLPRGTSRWRGRGEGRPLNIHPRSLAIILGMGVLLLVAGCVLTGSRWVYPVLAVETGFIFWPCCSRGMRRFLVGLGLVGMGGGLVLLAMGGLDSDRWAWWRTAVHIIGQHSWLGVGPGAFGEAYPIYRASFWDLNSLYAHNMFLEWAAERGLPLALSVFFGAGFLLYRSRQKPEAVALGGFFLYNLFHAGLSFPGLSWAVWALAGTLPGYRISENPSPGRGWGWVGFGGLLLFLMGSGGIYCGDQLLARVRFAAEEARWEEVGQMAQRGKRLTPREPEFYYWLSRASAESGRLGEAVLWARQLVTLAPGSAHFSLWRAQLAEATGEEKEALAAYQTATRLLPLKLESWEQVIRLAQRLGETNAAKEAQNFALVALDHSRSLSAQEKEDRRGRILQGKEGLDDQ